MGRTLTAGDLFDQLQERLDLNWVAGRGADTRVSISKGDVTDRPTLAGYLNLIHPNRVQVCGAAELRFLDELEPGKRRDTIDQILAQPLLAIMVGDGLEVPEDLLTGAEQVRVPLFQSSTSSYELAHLLQFHLSRVLARTTTLHGVYLEIFTIGVLITGDAGAGKSELALELINRGHRLIADDAPEFTQISPEIIDGTCPEALQDCLEVRGLGILNVRAMFGDSAIKLNKFLRLIVHLELPQVDPGSIDRLHGDTSAQHVLDLEVPQITLPVLPGRNLAVIIEAAVRDFMLKMKGYDAADNFLERHSQLLRRQRRDWER